MRHQGMGVRKPGWAADPWIVTRQVIVTPFIHAVIGSCACQKKYRRAPGKGSSRKEELCVANVHLRYECQLIAIRITEFGQPELRSRRAMDQMRTRRELNSLGLERGEDGMDIGHSEIDR